MRRAHRDGGDWTSELRTQEGLNKMGVSTGTRMEAQQKLEEAEAALAALRNFARRRDAVREAGTELALTLDKRWEGARAAATGPVDVVDMFAGCGGMSAGFVAVNALLPAYRLAMAVDIDRLAMATYETNLGVKPTELDLHAYAKRQVRLTKLVNACRRTPEAPLVLIGCAPCQGFSSHRNEAGEEDPRNTLFVTFAKVAAAIKPDAIIVENVPEVTTDRYWPVVSEGRRILERSGYHVVLTAHDMAEFGVPQHRFRAVMVAMRRPFNMPRGFLSGSGRRTVRQAIGGLPPIRPGQVCASDPMHFTAGHKASTIATIKAVPLDGGNRPKHVGPECLRRFEEENGKAAYEDVYGRLAWDRPAITITGHARNPASGRYVHPEQHRGLSVREAALLQGFPSTWQFSGGLSPCFMQVGNAVPPPFAAFLATHLLGELFGKAAEQVDRAVDIPASLGKSFSRLIPALKAGHRRLHAEEAAQ
jgi:DNA (cytosine-5)-methyltransferase 1